MKLLVVDTTNYSIEHRIITDSYKDNIPILKIKNICIGQIWIELEKEQAILFKLACL